MKKNLAIKLISFAAAVLLQISAFQSVYATGEETGTKVVFGVISDTHVTASKPTEQQRLTAAFQLLNTAAGADAVAVVGDLTDGGTQSEYDTWKAIKDANIGNMKLVASMGNHEGNSADLFTAATGDAPNANYVIKGYHFITLSPGSGILDTKTGKGTSQGGSNYTYLVDWLKTQLDAAVAEDPNKPVFIFFHHPMRYTFYVSDEWYGSGLATGSGDSFQSVFSNYPQAVTFSGHIHSPNNHPESIWQDGGFTAVNTVSLSYFEMETGMVYGTVPPDGRQCAQGMLIETDGSKVTIRNYDLISNQEIPQTWSFDVSKPSEFPYTKAREADAKAPVFPDSAAVRISGITDTGATVDFDQAVMEPNNIGDIVHSYRYDFINKKTGNIDKTFKTWSEYYMLPTPVTITQAAVGLTAGTEYEVRIYAIDAFRKVSDQFISTSFKTTGAIPVDPDDLSFEDLSKPIPAADLLDVDFSGGTVADRSPAAHAFTTSNGAQISQDSELGKYAAKFSAKASEGYLTPWTSEQYSKVNDGFTIESVFKADSFDGYTDFFGNMQGAGIGFELNNEGAQTGKAHLEVWAHISGYKVPRAQNAIEIGKWYHAVGVYDGKEVSLYLNGRKVASVPASGAVTTPGTASRKYVIGGDINSSGGIEAPFSGSVSLARMYSEPLSYVDIYRLASRELASNDEKAPMIRLSTEPSATGETGEAYSVPAYTAVDNSGNIETSVQVTQPDGTLVQLVAGTGDTAFTFIPDKPGKYLLKYTAVDKAGNKTQKPYEIVVTGQGEPSAATELTGTSRVKQGDTLLLGVKLNGTKGITAQDVIVSYDPDTFEYIGATSLIDTVKIWGTKAEGGKVEIMLASNGAENALMGNMKVLNLEFRVKAFKASTQFAVTKAELSNALGELTTAGLSSLTVTMINKQALDNLIAVAQSKLEAAVEGRKNGQYPAGSKARLSEAVRAAQLVSNNENAAQSQIDAAAASLQAAVDKFSKLVITDSTGDFNGNNRIDVGDLGIAAANYGMKEGDTGWNTVSKYDIDGDGDIDMYEMTFIALKNLGL